MNEQEIIKAIEILKPNGELFEIRMLGDKWNASAYFTSTEKCVEELRTFRPRKEPKGIYITLNKINNACYSRVQKDKFVENTPTTSDNDITRYSYLMIDLDPSRPANISSSEEELQYAKNKANEVYKYLKEEGFEEPVVALSGNGIHLLYKIDLPKDTGNIKLIENCLKALDMIFSDSNIQIDTAIYNPARICKLYGTVAKKGSDSVDRPHRMSLIVKNPLELKTNDEMLLKRLASNVPQRDISTNNSYERFDIDSWINKNNIKVSKKNSFSDGTRYVLEECPFNHEHKSPDSAIFVFNNGVLGFKCFHNGCSNYTWKDLRMLYEPEVYKKEFVKSSIVPNYTRQEIAPQISESMFKTAKDIRKEKVPPAEYIKTGVNELDKKMRGLRKGYVTCISGKRGSAKSTMISQFILEAIEQGYKVALFSGELTNNLTLDWLTLQAAGRNYVVSTQYENFYTVYPKTQDAVDNWLEGKLFVYNNDFGNNFRTIFEGVKKCVSDNKVDLIVLDNLMALNISELDKDKYVSQSLFVESLENFAKKTNIHIIFVAHPKKTSDFLRLEDVSGTNDLVNRVDNAFIIHRVNEDFKRLSKQMFHWKDESEIYKADNVIEICKDRLGGTQDLFIPLWFDTSCKRLMNYKGENRKYSWTMEGENSD